MATTKRRLLMRKSADCPDCNWVADSGLLQQFTRVEALAKKHADETGHCPWVEIAYVIRPSRPNLATPSPNIRHDPGLEAGETGE